MRNRFGCFTPFAMLAVTLAGAAFGAPPEVPPDVAAPQDKVREITVKVPAGKTLQYRAVGDKVAFREMKASAKGEAVFWLISETGGRSHVVWWFKGEDDSAVTDINKAATPPEPGPKPKPDPKPDPAKADSVWVIVVEDAAGPRTVEVAAALNDPFWQALRPKHDFRHYQSDSKTAIDNGYVKQAKEVGMPAVLVLDAKDGAPLKAFKLGKVADINTAVREVVK